jgi:hypothetical protein
MVLVGAMCLPPTGALPKLPLVVVVSFLSQDGSVSVVGVTSTGVWFSLVRSNEPKRARRQRRQMFNRLNHVEFATTDQLACAVRLHRTEKLTVPKLVKERTTSYATRGFITVLTTARHLSAFRVLRHQSKSLLLPS